MINEELTGYVKKELANGSTLEKIRTDLKDSGGWTNEDIDDAFINCEISKNSVLISNSLKYVGIWLMVLYSAILLFLLQQLISDTTGWGFVFIIFIPIPITSVLIGFGVYKKNIYFYKLAIALVFLHTLLFVSMLYEEIVASKYGHFDIKESAWLLVMSSVFLFTCIFCIRIFFKIKKDKHLVQKNVSKDLFIKSIYFLLVLSVVIQYMFLFKSILISFTTTSAPFGERVGIDNISVVAEKSMRAELDKLKSKGYKIELMMHGGTETYVNYSYSTATKNGVDYVFDIYTFDTVESLEDYIKDIPYIGPYYIGPNPPNEDGYVVYKKDTTLFLHREKDPAFLLDVESLYGKPIDY